MRITLIDAGKRFNRDWIFRHFDYQFHIGQSYAITGPNGSGKSTLLQAIAGAIELSEGKLRYEAIPSDQIYKQFSFSAPYLELIEEMTLLEFLRFHGSFKPFLPGIGLPEIVARVGLESGADKQIRYFSSGMKQRVKLAQSIFSDTPVILLDEPCTNLDAEGITLYRRLVDEYCGNRLLVVSSNDPQEYDFCVKNIPMKDHK